MTTSSPFWIALLLAAPVLSLAYVMTAYVVVRQYLPIQFEPYAHWFNGGFVVLLGSVLVLVGPFEIPVPFQWVYLAAVPAGIGLYALDSFLKTRLAGKPLQNGTESLGTMLPVLIVPIFEEVVFRAGYVFVGEQFGTGSYLVCSALAFGLHHVGRGPTELVLKFENGLVYGSLFVATGSLVPAVLAHVGYNVGAVLVLARTPWSIPTGLPPRS